ncbi:MAG: ornithine cyclodeaminase family protein [Armatimonadota bacterium]|nr:ornithine cyclodeaminase family protein [Armatimonadota bacterium]MDR7534189.1 ornithine cyclodeaminase family protein [Armatimonadota bacterium]
MALVLTPEQIDACLTYDDVLAALRAGFLAEAEGRVAQPDRLTTDVPSGWLRIMPAVVGGDGAGYMGCKVMNLVRGAGVRYLILLYSAGSGDLLAVMDAAQITQMRTAGVAVLAAQRMLDGPFAVLGVLGSGYEARGLLVAMAEAFPFAEAVVYSPRRSSREAFADAMSPRIGRPVMAVDSAEAVLHRTPVTVLATKSATPVLDGRRLLPGATVLSVGSTRLDLRELDLESLRRARWLLVDSVRGVRTESGDVRAALDAGVLAPERIVPLADVLRDGRRLRAHPDDVLVLKTVGTAMQDLVVAGRVYERARARGLGTEIGQIPQLKPFA